MRSIRPVIAGNGLAIILTVVFLLPTTAVVAFVATGPIDDFFANIGIWLHRTNEWSFPEFDTIERFSKIGFRNPRNLYRGRYFVFVFLDFKLVKHGTCACVVAGFPWSPVNNYRGDSTLDFCWSCPCFITSVPVNPRLFNA